MQQQDLLRLRTTTWLPRRKARWTLGLPALLCCLLLACSASADAEHRRRRRYRAHSPTGDPQASGGALHYGGPAGDNAPEEHFYETTGERSARGSEERDLYDVTWETAANAPKTALPQCRGDKQIPELTGTWVDHPDDTYRGMYDPLTRCPRFAADFNCVKPYAPVRYNGTLYTEEFRKIFVPDQCELRPWDEQGFDTCMEGRRLILLGDSLMRQSFQSLGCLAGPVVTDGVSADWRKNVAPGDNPKAPAPVEMRDYPKTMADGKVINTSAAWFGNFTMTKGGKVYIRNFGLYHLQLFDDMLADLQPLQPSDTIMINFGAWYGRFNWGARTYAIWDIWKADVREVILQRLVNVPAKVIWKSYSPTHFGGATGTFTNVEESLRGDPRLPPRDHCEPARVGEFWYDDYVRDVLVRCGQPCAHISFLPIFNVSLGRFDSHHGSFGRGRDEDKLTDCRHFCNNVVDVWNQVLYNFMCFS